MSNLGSQRKLLLDKERPRGLQPQGKDNVMGLVSWVRQTRVSMMNLVLYRRWSHVTRNLAKRNNVSSVFLI